MRINVRNSLTLIKRLSSSGHRLVTSMALSNLYMYSMLSTLRPSNKAHSNSDKMIEPREASTCEAETMTKGPNNAQLIAIWFAFTAILCGVLFLILYIVRRKLNLKHLWSKDLEAGGKRSKKSRKKSGRHVTFRRRPSFIPDESSVAR